MTISAGRRACPRCGANNFEAAPICWQCGAPMTGAAPVETVREQPRIGLEPLRAVETTRDFTGDPAVARRAALYLALCFPYFGLPIGWAFMMTPDARKQTVGRYCAMWSAAALSFHIVLMFLGAMAMGNIISSFTPSLSTEKQLEKRIQDLGGPQSGVPSQ